MAVYESAEAKNIFFEGDAFTALLSCPIQSLQHRATAYTHVQLHRSRPQHTRQ